MLKPEDTHYYGPLPPVLEWVNGQISETDKVLEIGPGITSFDRADVAVDYVKSNDKIVQCNVLEQRLPFEDKSFDFIYCRHVLEDLWNPFLLLSEMARVGKAGYIETPSPIAEVCRCVDGGDKCDKAPYRGYHHHFYLVWAHNGGLLFLPKMTMIEWSANVNDTECCSILKKGRYWNTYYSWKDTITYGHCQNMINFNMIEGDYEKLIDIAMKQSKASTDIFFKGLE